jgi:hypothetical protein
VNASFEEQYPMQSRLNPLDLIGMIVLVGIAILTSGFLSNTYARIVPLVVAGLIVACWAYARSGPPEASIPGPSIPRPSIPRPTATDRDVERSGVTAASRETVPRPDRTDARAFAGTVAVVLGICFLIVVAFLLFFVYQLAQSAG